MAVVSIVEVATMSLDEGVLRRCEDDVVGVVTSRASSVSSCGLASLRHGEKRWTRWLEEALREEEQGYSKGSR